MRNLLLTIATLVLTVSVGGSQGRGPTSFHPIEPCRVMDTRIKTILTCHPNFDECTHAIPNAPYAFIVAGDDTREALRDRGYAHVFPFTIADQGGKVGGCGIPRGARAVTLNITVNPIHDGPGHVRMWEYGLIGYHPFNGAPKPTKAPLASIINWPADHAPNSWYNNSVTIGICDPDTAPFNDCNEDLLIKPTGPVRVVIDVYGYYLP